LFKVIYVEKKIVSSFSCRKQQVYVYLFWRLERPLTGDMWQVDRNVWAPDGCMWATSHAAATVSECSGSVYIATAPAACLHGTPHAASWSPRPHSSRGVRTCVGWLEQSSAIHSSDLLRCTDGRRLYR